MVLKKGDLQLFFKNLRKANKIADRRDTRETPSIRYYAVGEYGGDNERPHYHIILFNARIELVENAWRKYHKELDKWTRRGDVHFGNVSGASIAYCFKYLQKQSHVGANSRFGDADDRTPEFRVSSKGLGESYLSPARKAWHKKKIQERAYCAAEDGEKVSMPRYYRDKIYDQEWHDDPDLPGELKKFRKKGQKAAIGTYLQLEGDRRFYEALNASERYFSDKVQADLAAFRKMYKNSKHGTTI